MKHFIRYSTLVAGGVAMIAMTAGCSGQFHATGTAAPPRHTPAHTNSGGSTDDSTTNGSSPAGGGTGSAGRSPGGAAPQESGSDKCKASNLKLSLGPVHGAAGSTIQTLQFTNTGTTSCELEGYPGVSYVGEDKDDNKQIGSAATRNATSSGGSVTLAPGAMASASVAEANPQNYAASDCDPMPARGFRVYAPGDTAAIFVPFSTSTPKCNNPRDTGLSVNAITPGSGN